MGATVMMYVLPMLLGQTYDLGKEKPGLLIYPNNIADDAVKIQRYLTDSQYRMVDNVAQMKDFLDVSGKLSLKIKGGMVDVSGEGGYLKDSSSKSNGLEILIKLHFETETLTIPSSKKPNADFTSMSQEYLGTHYCRSITYGGDLVAAIRISGSGKSDLEKIKGAISAGLKTGSGSFEGDIKGKLEMLKNNAVESSSMEISYYASVPIQGVSYTMDGLLKLVDNFPDHVRKVNGGLGNPLKMELYPLNSLSAALPEYLENRALSDELDDLDTQFDDLRNTRKQLAEWVLQLPPTLPASEQNLISDFANDLNAVYSVYLNTIGELDTTLGASTKPVNQAFEAYRGKDYMLPQKYARKLRKLQSQVYKRAPDLLPKFGGAQFVHWGRSECGSPDAETCLSGLAVASEISNDTKGGPNGRSGDYICSPLNPNLLHPGNVFKNDTMSDKDAKSSGLSPLKFKGNMNRYKSMFDKNIACAHCRINSRRATVTKMAARSCPDGWTKEYEGYVIGPRKDSGQPGELICVDESMEEPSGKDMFGRSSGVPLGISESTIRCGALPCGPYKSSKPIPCVVCTV